jgi:hypothetical protein
MREEVSTAFYGQVEIENAHFPPERLLLAGLAAKSKTLTRTAVTRNLFFSRTP